MQEAEVSDPSWATRFHDGGSLSGGPLDGACVVRPQSQRCCNCLAREHADIPAFLEIGGQSALAWATATNLLSISRPGSTVQSTLDGICKFDSMRKDCGHASTAANMFRVSAVQLLIFLGPSKIDFSG